MLAVLLCLSPLIIGWRFDNNDVDGPRKFSEASSSKFYCYSIVMFLTLLAPIFVDHVVDCFIPTFFTSYGTEIRPIGKTMFITLLILTNLLNLTVFIPSNNIERVVCVYYLVYLTVNCISFLRLMMFSEVLLINLQEYYIFFAFLFTTAAAISQVMAAFSGNNLVYFTNVSISSILINTIVVIRLCYLCWGKIKHKTWAEMNMIERDGFVLIFALPLALVLDCVIYIAYPGAFVAEALGLRVIILQILPFSRSVFERRNILTEASLQRKLDTKRKFVRMVSHEIRTPMNIVFNGLDIIKAELVRARCRRKALESWTDVKNAGGMAVELLDGLLLYEKLESGDLVLDMSKIEIWPFLAQAVRMFKVQAEQKGVSLKYDCEESDIDVQLRPYFIMADRSKLNQVARNLLSNAIKFSPQGGTIVVSAAIVEGVQGAKILRVSVKDSGVGISKANLAKLFNQIVQFEPNKNQGGGGSGIGLWITKGIMDLHNGKVTAESYGEGRGCTFIFEVPAQREFESTLVDVSTSIVELPPNSNLSSTSPRHRSNQIVPLPNDISSDNVPLTVSDIVRPFGSYDNDDNQQIVEEEEFEDLDNSTRLLVVDDAPVNLKMIKRLLQMRYTDIYTAVDGQQALDMVKTSMEEGRPFHAVLSDFQMPVMDGPTSVRAMRASGYNGKIIGVTGNGLPEDQELFLRSGANKILLKPVDSAVLFQTLADFLVPSVSEGKT